MMEEREKGLAGSMQGVWHCLLCSLAGSEGGWGGRAIVLRWDLFSLLPPPPQARPPALLLLPWHRHGGAVFLEPGPPRGHCVRTHLAAEEEPEGER